MATDSEMMNLFAQSIALVDWWRVQGEWHDAMTLLGGLHPVTQRLGSAAQARLWLQTGQTLTEEGMFSGRATHMLRQDALDKALLFAESANDSLLLGDVYDALGFSLHSSFLASDRSTEPEDELAFFERGLKLRKEGGTESQIAESLFHVGLVYDVIRKDYDKAVPYHEEAYERAMAVDDLIVASYAIRHLAFARMAVDDLFGAEVALVESLALRESAGFVPGAAFAMAALAHVYTLRGEVETAVSKLQQARQLLHQLGATARVEWIDKHIASLQDSER